MPKLLQILGWVLQLIGIGIIYIALFTDLGPRYGSRYIAVYLLVAFAFIAYGRRIYLPDVKLMKPCPNCGHEIKINHQTCPYCKCDLPVSSRFPGIGEG